MCVSLYGCVCVCASEMERPPERFMDFLVRVWYVLMCASGRQGARQKHPVGRFVGALPQSNVMVGECVCVVRGECITGKRYYRLFFDFCRINTFYAFKARTQWKPLWMDFRILYLQLHLSSAPKYQTYHWAVFLSDTVTLEVFFKNKRNQTSPPSYTFRRLRLELQPGDVVDCKLSLQGTFRFCRWGVSASPQLLHIFIL